MGKFLCWIGWHDWNNWGHPPCTCKRCGEKSKNGWGDN